MFKGQLALQVPPSRGNARLRRGMPKLRGVHMRLGALVGSAYHSACDFAFQRPIQGPARLLAWSPVYWTELAVPCLDWNGHDTTLPLGDRLPITKLPIQIGISSLHSTRPQPADLDHSEQNAREPRSALQCPQLGDCASLAVPSRLYPAATASREQGNHRGCCASCRHGDQV